MKLESFIRILDLRMAYWNYHFILILKQNLKDQYQLKNILNCSFCKKLYKCICYIYII